LSHDALAHITGYVRTLYVVYVMRVTWPILLWFLGVDSECYDLRCIYV